MTPNKYKLDIKAILTITLFPIIILTFSKFGFVLLVTFFNCFEEFKGYISTQLYFNDVCTV